VIERTFKGKAGRGKSKGQERSLTLQFPEWCRVTITRELTGKERSLGQHALDGAAHAAESRNASRPRVPERNANLSRRSCRNHSPSPHRHRPSFPNRSPPGKKAIPKSPMPSRPLLSEDDIDAWFRKHHTCPCGTNWWDEWDCLCNDRCPTCDAEIEPDEHEAIQGATSAKIRTLNDRFRKSLTGGRVMITRRLSAC
jgi:hypothetical protein